MPQAGTIRQLFTCCLFIASALCVVIIADEWLAAHGPAAVYGRIGLIIGVAAAGAVHCYRSDLGRCSSGPLIDNDESQAMSLGSPVRNEELVRDLSLAIEHIESIRVLLEISRAHQQPVPRAIPANLDLVLKNLQKAREQLSTQKPRELITMETCE